MTGSSPDLRETICVMDTNSGVQKAGRFAAQKYFGLEKSWPF
jgi:hypothetical protein